MWASMCCSNWRRRWSRIGSPSVHAATGSRSRSAARALAGGAGLLLAEGGTFGGVRRCQRPAVQRRGLRLGARRTADHAAELPAARRRSQRADRPARRAGRPRRRRHARAGRRPRPRWSPPPAGSTRPPRPPPIEATYLDDDDVAAVLFTSGTTSEPKGVVLRHGNLTAYVLQTVDLLGADEDDCALVAVPPYHIAGVATVLTNTYAGRRMVHLPASRAQEWLAIAAAKRSATRWSCRPCWCGSSSTSTSAPERRPLPALRSIAYGGARIAPDRARAGAARVPRDRLRQRLRADRDQLDHRRARSGRSPRRRCTPTIPVWRARLASAGRAVPGIEFVIRDPDGEAAAGRRDRRALGTRRAGRRRVRRASAPRLDADGWFPTRDRARLDEDGYLFVEGRDDDTIIRGGENIAPAEVEDVLLTHPAVRDAAVVGPARRGVGPADLRGGRALRGRRRRRGHRRGGAGIRGQQAALQPRPEFGADLARTSIHSDRKAAASRHHRQPDRTR